MLQVLLFATSGYATGDGAVPFNNVPREVESKASLLTEYLQEKGFEVSRGYFKLYTVEDCDYTFSKMRTCYSNNPSAPYVTFAVPPWPEEFVNDKSKLWGLSEKRYEDIYRLDPREAIVILGRLPLRPLISSSRRTFSPGRVKSTPTALPIGQS